MGATESKNVSITRKGGNLLLDYDWSLSDFQKLSSYSVGYFLTRDLVTSGDQKHEFSLCLYPCGFNERTKDYLTVCLKKKSVEEVAVRFTCWIVHGKEKEICRRSAKKVLALETVVGWTTFCKRNMILDKKLSLSNLTLKCQVEIFSSVLTMDEDDVSVSSKILSEDFQKLLDKNSFSDFDFFVESKLMKVHKSVLSARSPVFAAMFNCPLQPRQRESITDISYRAMSMLVKYMYTGRLDFIDVPTAMEVYYASDKYEIFFLRNACSEILSCNLTVDNVIKVLLLAYHHSDSDLLKQCLSFMDKNLREIKGREEWIKLMQQYPKLADRALFFQESS